MKLYETTFTKCIKLVLSLLLISGCSDKYQSLYDASPLPVIQFNKDTITIREKDTNNINQTDNGMLVIRTISPQHQLNYQLNGTSTKVKLKYKGTGVPNMQPMMISGDSVNLFCQCDTPGLYPVQVYLTNQLGKIHSKELIIQCLANKAPTRSFTITSKGSTPENYHYQFDATASKDPDGMIMEYHFTINGLSYITSSPILNWTFHQGGLQTAELYVIDDLSKHSDTLTKTFIIP